MTPNSLLRCWRLGISVPVLSASHSSLPRASNVGNNHGSISAVATQSRSLSYHSPLTPSGVIADFRSDTVTRPTPQMLDAMVSDSGGYGERCDLDADYDQEAWCFSEYQRRL